MEPPLGSWGLLGSQAPLGSQDAPHPAGLMGPPGLTGPPWAHRTPPGLTGPAGLTGQSILPARFQARPPSTAMRALNWIMGLGWGWGMQRPLPPRRRFNELFKEENCLDQSCPPVS